MTATDQTGEVIDTCPTCTARNVSRLHITRCALDQQCRADIHTHAQHANIDGHAAVELMLHLRDRVGDDLLVAYHRATTVIDLGWRP